MSVDSVNPAEVDFSDLEAKYAVDDSFAMDQYVLVDGLPVVPESKVEKLTKVLVKQFTKVAPLARGEAGFFMPISKESGSSQGFAFVEFETVDGAAEVIKAFNHKKLDAKHTLLVDKMATVLKYVDGADSEYKEPTIPPFKSLPHLRSWLADPLGRDQAVMSAANGISVYWFRKGAEPRPAMEPSTRFTDGFVQWSPLGTYLLSSHPQGVALHAGPEFEIVARFPHRDVRLVNFSPDEKFLVTASKTPIKIGGPFKEADEGNNIAVWSIETQAAMRTFAFPAGRDPKLPPEWPPFQWSGSSRYFARIAQPNMLSIYDTETFSLVGKKSMQISGIASFQFAPEPINGRELLAFWTPEAANQTAKVCIVNAATKEVVHSRPMFNVVTVQFFWQNEGKFLCCKIDRLTKNKKALTSSLEIYRMAEKDFPIEVLDFKETVLNFAWEPRSDRFATISYFEAAPAPGQMGPAGAGIGGAPLQMNTSRNVLSFFALEREKKLKGTWKEAYNLGDKSGGVTDLSWSPRARFLSAYRVSGGKITVDLYDASHEQAVPAASTNALPAAADLPINVVKMRQVEHLGAQTLSWDPSGRYIITAAVVARDGGNSGGRGFHLYDVTGNVLRKQTIDGLGYLIWRPRPASLLPKDARKKISKTFKEKTAEFDLQDASLAMEDSQDIKRKREELATKWAAFRSRARTALFALNLVPEEDKLEVKDGEVYLRKLTVVEEEEEVVE